MGYRRRCDRAWKWWVRGGKTEKEVTGGQTMVMLTFDDDDIMVFVDEMCAKRKKCPPEALLVQRMYWWCIRAGQKFVPGNSAETPSLKHFSDHAVGRVVGVFSGGRSVPRAARRRCIPHGLLATE